LRVSILPCSRLPAIAVTGRGTGLSQGGMALHAGVDMELGDLIEIEFPTPHPVKVMATVRNRNGRYFGLEFPYSRVDRHRNSIYSASEFACSPRHA
jgi:hypothetical protein